MFLDMNSYFASVEQAEDPKLRGKPIVVVPMVVDTTFIIAASVEAKRAGIKMGMRVAEAKKKLPELILVPASTLSYVHYHEKIIEAVEQVLPVEKVCSIDEMRFRLLGDERNPDEAIRLANMLKDAIRDFKPSLTCSVGIAPNSFLSKLCTDLQKPNGLVMMQEHELPDRLRGLKLTEFCGINWRMEARLKAKGIFTSDDLLKYSPRELREKFGSVVGERWWYLLRGYTIPETERPQKSLGHSHVLPPNLRSVQGCRDVLLRLAHKASARLRNEDLYAETISVYVRGHKRSWSSFQHVSATQDTLAVVKHVLEIWQKRDFDVPRMVGLTFTDLKKPAAVTPSLFDNLEKSKSQEEASKAMDKMNQKFGKNSIFLSSIDYVKDTASEKIAFNKTWLFSEGKGDNIWQENAS